VKTGTGGNPRLAALALLGSVLESGLSLSEAGEEIRLSDSRDRGLALHLAYGVLRWLSALEWLSDQLLDRPLRRRDRDIHRLILLGLFQLWKDGSAPHAAINETSGCARALGKSWAVGLVNAVLRRFQREQSQWLTQLQQSEERFAHPGWLLRALRNDWPDRADRIMEANNHAAPMWLRLNTLYSLEETLAALTEDGLVVSRHPLAEQAVKVEPARPVERLPGFMEGRFSVQDPAAQLAAKLLEATPDMHVLDACAAPGGKACHLLERVPGIRLVAVERSRTRMNRIGQNLDRLGLTDRLELHHADATEPSTWWGGRAFDRILLDAPCSATGVIRRHPEIKWLREPVQIDEVAALQKRLLERLWPLLRPGGILLYATCSVLKAENSRQVSNFADLARDAEIVPFPGKWGAASGGGRQIFPGELEMDGFFYARFRKSLQD
jgi:16S rRNA (cytosine967-C5)-methyltransferase